MCIESLFPFRSGNYNINIIIFHIIFGGNDRLVYKPGKSASALYLTILLFYYNQQGCYYWLIGYCTLAVPDNIAIEPWKVVTVSPGKTSHVSDTFEQVVWVWRSLYRVVDLTCQQTLLVLWCWVWSAGVLICHPALLTAVTKIKYYVANHLYSFILSIYPNDNSLFQQNSTTLYPPASISGWHKTGSRNTWLIFRYAFAFAFAILKTLLSMYRTRCRSF